VHTYSGTWSFDDSKHWRECDCGSKTDEAEHDMEWTVLTEATKETPGTEQGVCKVCGYTTQRETEYKGMSLIVKILLGLVILALILGAAWFILNTIADNKRRKRRKKSGRSSGGYSSRSESSRRSSDYNRSESSRRSSYDDYGSSDYSGRSSGNHGEHSSHHGGSHSSHEHYEPRHGRHDGSSYDQWDDSRWGDR
ncbi:MAG: hypothetical protein V8T45_00685, partial [Oscillospiraceae bacterium]